MNWEDICREQANASKTWKFLPAYIRLDSTVTPFDSVYRACYHLTDEGIDKVAEFAEELRGKYNCE